MPIDTEQLIKEVEKRPSLWDNHSKQFKDKNLKNKAWKELCDIFVPNYPAMDSAAKNREAIGLQRKWKSLRDSFNRELKARRLDSVRAPVDPERKPCHYYEQLSFLEPILEAKMRHQPGSSKEADMGRPGQDLNLTVHGIPCKRKRSCGKVVDGFDSHSSIDDLDESEGDPDIRFFQSLIPHIKKLPKPSRQHLKSEFVTLVKKYTNRKVNLPLPGEEAGSSMTTLSVLNGGPPKADQEEMEHLEEEETEEEEDIEGSEDTDYRSSDTSPGLSAGYTDESAETEDGV